MYVGRQLQPSYRKSLHTKTNTGFLNWLECTGLLLSEVDMALTCLRFVFIDTDAVHFFSLLFHILTVWNSMLILYPFMYVSVICHFFS